jgi:hypothetical protein
MSKSFKKYEQDEFKNIPDGSKIKYFEKTTFMFQSGKVCGYVYKEDKILLKVSSEDKIIFVSTPVWVIKNNSKESTEVDMEIYQLKKIVHCQNKEINDLKKKLLKITEILKKRQDVRSA